MTDFVNRLLGRSGAPAIWPVVPSLFEPVVTAIVQRPLPTGEVTDIESPVLPAGSGPSRVVEGRQPAGRKRQASVAAGPGITAHTAAGPVAGPEPAPHEPAATAVGTPLSDAPAKAVVAHPVDMPRQASVSEAEDPPTAGMAPMVTAAHKAHPVAGDIARTRSHPVAAVVRHDASERPAPRTVSPVRQQESAPEPTVHISIGRVEVKAVAAPAPAKRPERGRRAAPSLDDYLRDRTGGERG